MDEARAFQQSRAKRRNVKKRAAADRPHLPIARWLHDGAPVESQRKATEMQSSKIPALLVLVAAALAGCQAETNLSSGQTLAPTGGWITPDPVHSTSDSGSVSDAASGSMVFEGQRR